MAQPVSVAPQRVNQKRVLMALPMADLSLALILGVINQAVLYAVKVTMTRVKPMGRRAAFLRSLLKHVEMVESTGEQSPVINLRQQNQAARYAGLNPESHVMTTVPDVVLV